jgi:hypothetical protein
VCADCWFSASAKTICVTSEKIKKNKELSMETKLTNEPLRNLYIKIDTNKSKKVNNN